jgi:predicted Zn finger-like uncharacterized protein
MLIACPSCASRYELDDGKIGAEGRKVRCPACRTVWHVDRPVAAAPEPDTAEAPDAAFPPAPDASETSAELAAELERAADIAAEVSAIAAEQGAQAAGAATTDRPRRRPQANKRRRGNPLAGRRPATIGLALAGCALAGLALWQREPVVRAVPQVAALYAAIGLPVNLRGLVFSAVESEIVQDAQGRFLVVEGDITNVARRNTSLPPIAVTVRDAAGQDLYSWTTEPPRPELEPAALVRFRARLAQPPEAGRSVQVRFGGEARTAAAAPR